MGSFTCPPHFSTASSTAFRLHVRSPLPQLPSTTSSSHVRVTTKLRVAIRPPPPGFDYMREMLDDSRRVVGRDYPELMDLVDEGNLVVVEKRRFGPTPSWRSEFVEPEMIWVVGTSHVSERSAVDAERVVKAVRPDNVVVELCRSRAGIMYISSQDEISPPLKSNMFALSGSRFFDAIGRSINLGGQSALALRLLLAVFSSKITSNTNRPFGDEFRAARKASEEIGAQIVLGDRPIEITLERAWNSLNWNEKLKFVFSLFRGITSESMELPERDLENVQSDGGSNQLYEQLSLSYPSLLQSLVHERDVYLAWSLKRSKAVNNCKSVVGVIGRGHLNGVIHALISDLGDLRFRDLAGGKSSSDKMTDWRTTLLIGLVRDTIIGIFVWALYELSMHTTQ